jgi:uncharacterized protein YkwD
MPVQIIFLILSVVTLHPCEQDLIERVNAERKIRNLVPLKLDDRLLETARLHCQWMANRRSMTHSSYSVAENIAMGYSDSGKAMFGWLRSSGHRANILNPRYRYIGVAGYKSANGTCYWCQQFR